jgi:Ser/Thr protein kinase RdoA (MazF antagonist)
MSAGTTLADMKPYSELTDRGRAGRARRMVAAALFDYGLEGSRIRFLAAEWNLLFRIDTPDGRRFAMRVSDPQEHRPSHTATEVEWLLALGGATNLHLVQPVKRLDGAYLSTAQTPGIPGPRSLVLFSWVPGVPLERRLSTDAYARFGAAAAVLHQHGTPVPRRRDLIAWDRVFYWPEQLVIYDPAYARHFPPERMRVVRRAEERVAAELARLPQENPGPQLIHGDLHFWNVHIHRGDIWLFDFEDVMAGYPVQDVAITLFYGRDRADYAELTQAFRRGYTTVAPWPARSERQLRTLMAGRTLTFMNYMARVAADPEPYLAKTTTRLESFLKLF